MMSSDKVKYLFVGGSGRSGTTLLQAILNSHREIYGGPEFGYLPSICELRNKIQSSINPKNKLDVYMDIEKLNQAVGSLIKELISEPGRSQNAKVIAEKSPHNINYFKDLAEIIPSAKFIFVVRDPRAICASAKNIKEKAKLNNSSLVPKYSKNITETINYINSNWKNGFSFVKNNPSSALLVFYEDLVEYPESITKEICDFIEIKWDPQMLNHVTRMNNIIGEKEESIWGGADLYHKSIHKNSIDKWKHILNNAERGLVDKYIFKNDIIQQKYFNNNLINMPCVSKELLLHKKRMFAKYIMHMMRHIIKKMLI